MGDARGPPARHLGGGLFIKQSPPPDLDSVEGVELYPPGASMPMLLTGKVVRTEPDGFALKLDPVPSTTIDQLDRLVIMLSVTEPGSPSPRSLDEANARITILQSELQATRERLDKVTDENVSNRAFLARALAGRPTAARRGVGVLHVVFMGLGVGLGVFASVALIVLRGEPTQYEKPTEMPQFGSTFEAGKTPPPRPRDAGVVVRDAGSSVDAGRVFKPLAVAPPQKAEPGDAGQVSEDGRLNLKSNGASEVWVDGKKIGRSPMQGVVVSAGKHSARFDCVGDGGARRGSNLSVEVPPFAEVDVDFDCE